MALSSKQKAKAIKEHQRHDKDTGSAESQIAILTKRIEEIISHLKSNPKDKHSRRGLLGIVSKRKKLLKFLKNKHEEIYGKIIEKLGLKK